MCKKLTVCPHCGAPNGTVKKCGLLKISHEVSIPHLPLLHLSSVFTSFSSLFSQPYRSHKRSGELVQRKLAEFDGASEGNKEIESLVSTSGLIKVYYTGWKCSKSGKC